MFGGFRGLLDVWVVWGVNGCLGGWFIGFVWLIGCLDGCLGGCLSGCLDGCLGGC